METAPPNRDRLTKLLPEIRLHILGFLPFRDAVRTAVLSSEWRYLRTPPPSSLRLVSTAAADPSFSRHVDLLLLDLLRVDPLRRHVSLHLVPPSSVSYADLRRWLHYAAATSVSYLSVDLAAVSTTTPLYLKFWWPHEDQQEKEDEEGKRIENPSLVHLRLSNLCLLVPPLDRIQNPRYCLRIFPLLDTVILTNVGIMDFELSTVTANCPLLRTLEIRGCNSLPRISISHTSIVTVVIVDCKKLLKITIVSPALKKFYFIGNYRANLHLEPSEEIEDFYLCCRGEEAGLPRKNWIEMVAQLNHVRVLTLCSQTLECMSITYPDAREDFQKFLYLKELQLVMYMMTESNLEDIFNIFRLCNFPNLENLFLEFPTHMHDPYVKNFLDGEKEARLPESVSLNNLKIVKIANFNGHYHEMQLVRFLLRKTTQLESFIVVATQEYHSSGERSNSASRHLQELRADFPQIAERIIECEHDDNRVRPTHFDIQ